MTFYVIGEAWVIRLLVKFQGSQKYMGDSGVSAFVTPMLSKSQLQLPKAICEVDRDDPMIMYFQVKMSTGKTKNTVVTGNHATFNFL